MIKTKNTEKATAVNLEACGSTFSGRSSFQRTVSVMPLLYDFEDELRTVAGATNWQVASMGPQLYATDDHGLVPSSPLQWSRSLMPRMIGGGYLMTISLALLQWSRSLMPRMIERVMLRRRIALALQWSRSLMPRMIGTIMQDLPAFASLQWSRSLMPRMIDIDTYWSETPFLASMEPQLNATDDPRDLRARIRRSQGFNGAAA